VSASTRLLPSTAIEFTVCATATPDVATITQPAPIRVPTRTTHETASPRTARTQRPIRYLITLAAAPAGGLDKRHRPLGWMVPAGRVWHSACFVQRFSRTANGTPSPSFPFPSKSCPTATFSGRPRKEDAFYVIKGCKNHQHDHDCQPNPEPNLLGALGQGAAADRLDSVEQKVTAIEQRDRK
jgi:hypothetical protein